MDHLKMLVCLLQDAIGNDTMGNHNRAAQYLTAVGAIGQAAARWHNAKSELETCAEFTAGTEDQAVRKLVVVKRQRAQYDFDLADFELKMLEQWMCTLSGIYWRKEVAVDALKTLATEVTKSKSTLFPKPLSKKKLNALLQELAAAAVPIERPQPASLS